MDEKLFLNKEVSKITGLSQRQVLSWTEKGLIVPDKPAKKAGNRRGYNYKNLLEFGLSKYLIDVIALQFYSVNKILNEIREDGDFELWATNYSQYSLSFSVRTMNKKKEYLGGSHESLRVNDPRGLGGTLEFTYPVKKPKEQKGTLYYIHSDYLSEKGETYIETLRLITPWDFSGTVEAFQNTGYAIEEIMKSKGLIIINLGRIKEEIDKGIEEVKKE